MNTNERTTPTASNTESATLDNINKQDSLLAVDITHGTHTKKSTQDRCISSNEIHDIELHVTQQVNVVRDSKYKSYSRVRARTYDVTSNLQMLPHRHLAYGTSHSDELFLRQASEHITSSAGLQAHGNESEHTGLVRSSVCRHRKRSSASTPPSTPVRPGVRQRATIYDDKWRNELYSVQMRGEFVQSSDIPSIVHGRTTQGTSLTNSSNRPADENRARHADLPVATAGRGDSGIRKGIRVLHTTLSASLLSASDVAQNPIPNNSHGVDQTFATNDLVESFPRRFASFSFVLMQEVFYSFYPNMNEYEVVQGLSENHRVMDMEWGCQTTETRIVGGTKNGRSDDSCCSRVCRGVTVAGGYLADGATNYPRTGMFNFTSLGACIDEIFWSLAVPFLLHALKDAVVPDYMQGVFGQGLLAFAIRLPFPFLRACMGANTVAALFTTGIVPALNCLVLGPHFSPPTVVIITTLLGIQYNCLEKITMYEQAHQLAPSAFWRTILFSGLPSSLLERIMDRPLSSYEAFAADLVTFLFLRGVLAYILKPLLAQVLECKNLPPCSGQCSLEQFEAVSFETSAVRLYIAFLLFPVYVDIMVVMGPDLSDSFWKLCCGVAVLLSPLLVVMKGRPTLWSCIPFPAVSWDIICLITQGPGAANEVRDESSSPPLELLA